MKLRNTMSMRMKLYPEPSCLEAQEKFWRGRLKEISDKFDEERRSLQEILFQISSENQHLKKEIDTLRTTKKHSVLVQTAPISAEEKTMCKHCQQKTSNNKTTMYFEEKDLDFHKKFPDEEQGNNSSFKKMPVLRNDWSSFATDENSSISSASEYVGNENSAEKTITKLFSSDHQSDSQQIANKLIELYEKRSKLVPELDYEEENENLSMVNGNSLQNNSSSVEMLENVNKIDIEEEKNGLLHPTTKHNLEKRTKIKLLPAMQIVRKRVLKNFSRIKRSCVDIKPNNGKLKLCTNNTREDISNDYIKNDVGSKKVQLLNNETDERIQTPKCQLISAMKKSKSTGNIVKKVAFLDDLPSTSKTISESNLLDLENYRTKPNFGSASLLVDAVHIHRDKYAKPIPAPRSKKNIIIGNL